MLEETDTPASPGGALIDSLTGLPETIHSHATHLAEQTAVLVAKKMTDHWVNTATFHLDTLLSQKQSIKYSTSHLALLMQRVNSEKSSITQASEWYGQKTWFEKVSLGVMFVAAVSLLGAIVNVAVVFGVLAAGLYSALTSILQAHYDINIARDERFCNDIRALEKALAESVEHLKELEGQLRTLLIELAEKNLQSAEHLLQFEKNIRALDEKVLCFENVITELERMKLTLIEENTRITAQLNTARIDLEAANRTLIQRSAELDGIQGQMRDTNERIAAKTSELHALCEQFTTDSKALSVLIEGYETQLQLLRQRTSIHAPDDAMNASMKETMALRKLTDESIAKDKALIEMIRRNRQTPQSAPPAHPARPPLGAS